MKNDSFRLAVVGIGGVGGVLAAPLVRKYGGAVSLVARGKRGAHLREKGLTLHSDVFGTFTAYPETVAETPAELPVQDFVLVCVKNDALPKVTGQIGPIVGPETVVVPVMNGVTAEEVLREGLSTGRVAGSVIYTVSSAGADFSITQSGLFTHLFVDDLKGDGRMAQLRDIMAGAGIDFRLTSDSKTAIWNKYVFNCAYNAMTAAEAANAGALKREPLRSDFASILGEARAVGCRCGAALAEGLVEKELHRLERTGDGAESSLSRDFAQGRRGELEVFSGDLIRMAERLGVETPVTRRYYEKLLDRAKNF